MTRSALGLSVAVATVLGAVWACNPDTSDDKGVMRMQIQKLSGGCRITLVETEDKVLPAFNEANVSIDSGLPCPQLPDTTGFASGSEQLRVLVDYGVDFDEAAENPTPTLHVYFDGVEVPAPSTFVPLRAGARRGAEFHLGALAPPIGSRLTITVNVGTYSAQLDSAVTVTGPVVGPPVPRCGTGPCTYSRGFGLAQVEVPVQGAFSRTVEVLSYVDGVRDSATWSAPSVLDNGGGSRALIQGIPVPSPRIGGTWELVARVGTTESTRVAMSIVDPRIDAPTVTCSAPPCTYAPGFGTVQVVVGLNEAMPRTVELLSAVDGVRGAATWTAVSEVNDAGGASHATINEVPVPVGRDGASWTLMARIGSNVSPITTLRLTQPTVTLRPTVCNPTPCMPGVGVAEIDVEVASTSSRTVELFSTVAGVRDPAPLSATTVPVEDGRPVTHHRFSLPVPLTSPSSRWDLVAHVGESFSSVTTVPMTVPTIAAAFASCSACVFRGNTTANLVVSAPNGIRAPQAKVTAAVDGIPLLTNVTVNLDSIDLVTNRVAGTVALPLPMPAGETSTLQVDATVSGFPAQTATATVVR